MVIQISKRSYHRINVASKYYLTAYLLTLLCSSFMVMMLLIYIPILRYISAQTTNTRHIQRYRYRVTIEYMELRNGDKEEEMEEINVYVMMTRQK